MLALPVAGVLVGGLGSCGPGGWGVGAPPTGGFEGRSAPDWHAPAWVIRGTDRPRPEARTTSCMQRVAFSKFQTFQTFKFFKLSNFSNFSNFRTFQTFKLFKLSNFQSSNRCFKLSNFSNFQTSLIDIFKLHNFKLSNFQSLRVWVQSTIPTSNLLRQRWISRRFS